MDSHKQPVDGSDGNHSAVGASHHCDTVCLDAAPDMLSSQALKAAIKKAHTLLTHAVATVENTFELIQGSGSAVGVTDSDGTMLFSRTDINLVDPCGRLIFEPGSCWKEEIRGRNAIGVSLIECNNTCVRPEEHHLPFLKYYCTCAAPISNYRGVVVGTIAMLTKCESGQLHTLGFIRTTAALVENRMLIAELADEITLYFHSEPNNIGTIKQCIVVFDKNGGLIGSNSCARAYLNIKSESSLNSQFTELFASSFHRIEESRKLNTIEPICLSLLDGRKVYAILNKNFDIHGPGIQSSVSTISAENMQARPVLRGNASQLILSDLDTGDPQVQRAIEKAQRIIGLDLPLIIEGESGVGKEMFTRAFHNSGPRRHGPFVAVNCAAIPEGLIESELFGYEEGAFTGAKRRGNMGRILQANGGTLFLDEIGDMPLSLQGHLLRVLQEREVYPLGSSKAVAVDFSLVCATHRNLREEIREGRFREDLYYRLNGLRILLPALRDRKDLVQLVYLILKSESGEQSVQISQEVIEAFKQAEWPGNIRQLQMLLRAALALAGPGSIITTNHLPDEFLVDLSDTYTDLSAPTKNTRKSSSHVRELAKIELLTINLALTEAAGNISEAARTLGISRKTLYRKLEKIKAIEERK